jgi:SAM-dependent methyltransferase
MPTYTDRFQDAVAAGEYEGGQYSPGSYSWRMWNIQRPFVERIIHEHRRRAGPIRHLDFACGTGRILAALEPLCASSTGVDASESMLEIARESCRRSTLVRADVRTDPLPGGPFQLITAFRFLLNAEPALRETALARLRERLDPERGILLVNVHGSSASLRHWVLAARRVLTSRNHTHPANELPPGEVSRLLEKAGFAVDRVVGIGLIPEVVYRTPFARAAQWIDFVTADSSFLRMRCIDLLFVCRPAASSCVS